MRPTDPNASALNRRVAVIEKRLDGIDLDNLQRTSAAHEKAIAVIETALATLRGRVEAHLAPESQSPMRAARPIDAGTITLHGNPPSKGDSGQPHDRVVPRAGLISLAERAEMLLRTDMVNGDPVSVDAVPHALRLYAQSVTRSLAVPSVDRHHIAASLVRLALFLDAHAGE